MEMLRRLFGRTRDHGAHSAGRWIVVDTETSGLDAARDSLLAIGAVGVDEAGIRVDDSFEVVVRHAGSIRAANAVVHGLGQDVLSAGVPAEEALRLFHAWAADAPCVAFHADFDRRVLARAAALAQAPAVAGGWLDLAPLAAALRPDVPRRGAAALDDWLAIYGIACPGRHNAASDAMASAELLLRVRAEAAAQGAVGFDQLGALARHRRWLGAHF